jgi:outer membrane protein assembly factor BamB
MRASRLPLIALPLLSLLGASTLLASPHAHWPQWRGPLASGVAPAGNPPVEWSETRNVRFKVEIPGRGLSTPVVWGDRIFLTTAVPVGAPPSTKDEGWMRSITADSPQRFVVMALDRATGKVLWERTAREGKPHEGTHQDASWASASPVVDAEMLFASFGSNGLYAYDHDGNLRWSKDLGDMKTRNGFGEGSSPVLVGETLVVNWDHEAGSFIVALDRKTGNERWRREREEVTSWSTPLVVEHGGKQQVIVPATGRTRGYDLATGEVIWQLAGMTVNSIPSPVVADGVVYVMSGFRGNALQAIRLDQAKGDLAGSPALAWSFDRDTPYVPSPVLHEGLLYFLKHNTAILSALDAKSGEVRYGPHRLEKVEGVYASPIVAAGRLYVVGRNGFTEVLRTGPKPEVLAANKLDDRFDASPVVVGDELLLRGHRHLYAIGAAAAK